MPQCANGDKYSKDAYALLHTIVNKEGFPFGHPASKLLFWKEEQMSKNPTLHSIMNRDQVGHPKEEGLHRATLPMEVWHAVKEIVNREVSTQKEKAEGGFCPIEHYPLYVFLNSLITKHPDVGYSHGYLPYPLTAIFCSQGVGRHSICELLKGPFFTTE